MKKYISIILLSVMLAAFSACNDKNTDNSSNVDVTTQSTEVVSVENDITTTTTTTTTVSTEPTTKKSKDTSLTSEYTIGDITFKLPENCDIETTDISSGNTTVVNFEDSSMIQIAKINNTYNLSFSEISDAQKTTVLTEYANSFVYGDAWQTTTELENVNINGIKALKQEALNSGVISVSLYHFVYGESIYTFAFSKIPMYEGFDAYNLQNTIIDSLEFKSTENVTVETPTEKQTSSSISLGKQNALEEAKDYLKYSSFSYEGLIEQLEYEKYSYDEAVYAVNNCGANWDEQALLSAKNYIEYSGFSYQGLVEQLEYEKFTYQQAVYGADNCGANWNAEAAESAENYLKYSSFSRQELLEQLLYEGFTQEQAEYGVQSVGY